MLHHELLPLKGHEKTSRRDAYAAKGWDSKPFLIEDSLCSCVTFCHIYFVLIILDSCKLIT